MPDISVIVALLNTASTVKAAISSVVEQRGVDYELLVVDGGSTDGSWEIVKEFGDAVTWGISEPDRGIYDAWNKALDHATGCYVCFLGADDRIVDRYALKKLLYASSADADLVSCMASYAQLDGKGEYALGAAWDWERMCRRMSVEHRCLLHKRSLYEKFGLFDTAYGIAGDYDFLLRCGPGTKAVHVPEPLVMAGTEGVSHRQLKARLQERRRAQLGNGVCSPFKANLYYWVDLGREMSYAWVKSVRGLKEAL